MQLTVGRVDITLQLVSVTEDHASSVYGTRDFPVPKRSAFSDPYVSQSFDFELERLNDT